MVRATKILAVVAVALAGLLAAAGNVNADPVGGRKTANDVVSAYSTDTYRVACYGGEVTRFRLAGDHGTELDLFVYDEDGNLIVADVAGSGDVRGVVVRPGRTQKLIVRIVNRGPFSNHYAMVAD